MRTSIGCGVVLLSVLGNVTEAAGVSDAVLAGNRGLSPIITNTTYNYDAHFNHFHLNIRPPERVPLPDNLLAVIEELPIMLAAAPSSTATDAGAASAPVPVATQQTKYDAVYSMCGYMHSADQVPYNIERDNVVSPSEATNTYFFELNGKLPNFASGQGEPEPLQVKVLKGPAHGALVPATKTAIYFVYHANPGYLGSDQMVFEVETMGKKFKVIQTVVIDNSGNLDYPTPDTVKTGNEVCPDDKGSFLDIIELPTDGFASDEELAMLHSMLSFALGGVGGMSNGSLNIADLPNAAVGQTTGSTVTLDTNAAGYNWFIDTTPTDNSEYLPTSNPNEWVAKAGSAAAGKMDMLSVLLHEYGHALGINHSADPNDFMGTTLTAGVRRLPSAAEMALMQGLVAEAKAVLTESTPSLTLPLQGGGNSAPSFPTLPLGTSFIGFLGLLRSSRYGGVSIAADANTLVTQYDWAANPILTNGSLNAADGWSTRGAVDIGNGAATLREISTTQTRLSQVFLLNPTDRFLSFTLSGTALDDLTGAPDDAFEVALLDANTGASLLSGTGQTRTDAFLNLQADGTQNLANCVTCINNADGSRTYRVDLAGVPAGIAANLSFDLIGFGANGSHVTVSDVRLSGLPQLHDEAATMLEDGTLAFNPFAQVDNPVLSNVEGAAVLQLGSHVVDQPAHGAVTVNADGTR